MLDKIKMWILGSVIVKKVIQKVAKHAATALIGFLNSNWVAATVFPILVSLGISVDFDKLETGMIVLLTGLLGGLWNFIDHRFFNKSKVVPSELKAA